MITSIKRSHCHANTTCARNKQHERNMVAAAQRVPISVVDTVQLTATATVTPVMEIEASDVMDDIRPSELTHASYDRQPQRRPSSKWDGLNSILRDLGGRGRYHNRPDPMARRA